MAVQGILVGDGHYLLGELNDQRQLVGLDKRQKVLFGKLSIKGITALIKLWRQNIDTLIQILSILICQ